MSGGHFQYKQYAIDDIADSIEDYLYGHDIDETEARDIFTSADSDEEAELVIKNRHTLPNRHGYRFKTLQEMRRAVKYLRVAAVYAQRVDWLMSGDDSEEKFMERLINDLKAVRRGREIDYSKND